jgi:hypothetical protein
MSEMMMTKMKPTPGRIVMYQPPYAPDTKLPAIVIKVHGGSSVVNLQVFQDRGGDGAVYASSIEEGTGPGTWSWPERAA